MNVEDSDWIAIPQVAGIVGVPMMPGLAEAEGETIVFDKPGGRIMEARLHGSIPVDEVSAWYQIALPANGWVSQSGGSYQRQGEILMLAIVADDAETSVLVSLAPDESQ